MVKRKGAKKGYYTHMCLRIIPQGKWREIDRRGLMQKFEEHRNKLTKISGSDYTFFDKLTRIDKRSEGCNLCGHLYDLLEDKDPRVDTRLYLGHHHLYLGEDEPDMITFVEFLRDDPKVKKFQLLYLDSLKEMKTTVVSVIKSTELKDLISYKEMKISSFIELLKKCKFETRVLYEVSRDSYY